MSRGPYPMLLMLAMSLPSAAKALGLGDIRIDSALNEPLSAQIDIVGATRDELVALTAKVAPREIFQRYGADRPSFLATATFKVGLDAQGRPVLNVRSSEAFTDPVINFLVDLRWDKGELIREYSLLLDPAELSLASRLAAAAAASAPAVETAPAAPSPGPTAPAPLTAAVAVRTRDAHASAVRAPTTVGYDPVARTAAPATLGSQHRVVVRDTLRGIARRAGAVTESHAQRMMLAIYRANPHAFESNINVLHLGAVLNMPSATDVAAIDAGDAKREVRAQMTTWRLAGRPSAPSRVAALPPASSVTTAALAAVPAHMAAPGVAEATTDALKGRVQSLEKALEDMHKQLADENARIQDLKQLTAQAAAEAATPVPQHAAPAAATTPVAAPAATVAVAPDPRVAAPVMSQAVTAPPVHVAVMKAVAAPEKPAMGKALLGSMVFGLAGLFAGVAFVRKRFSRADAQAIPRYPLVDQPEPAGAGPLEAGSQPPPETKPSDAEPAPRGAVRTLAVTPAAIVAREIPVRSAHQDATDYMGIDTEALERSYLDALGIDASSFTIETTTQQTLTDAVAKVDASTTADTATHDTSDMNTVALDASELEGAEVDTSEVDTAVTKADLNTVILDTKKMHPATVNSMVLDYNLLDLDATAQHVHMPSDLHDSAVITERRTNIVDVLKTAIDRDPNRRDLRMKLLETYYSTAALNQRAFLDVVRKLARDRDSLSAEEWQKIVVMGREIAPSDNLFTDRAAGDDLADCA